MWDLTIVLLRQKPQRGDLSVRASTDEINQSDLLRRFAWFYIATKWSCTYREQSYYWRMNAEGTTLVAFVSHQPCSKLSTSWGQALWTQPDVSLLDQPCSKSVESPTPFENSENNLRLFTPCGKCWISSIVGPGSNFSSCKENVKSINSFCWRLGRLGTIPLPLPAIQKAWPHVAPDERWAAHSLSTCMKYHVGSKIVTYVIVTRHFIPPSASKMPLSGYNFTSVTCEKSISSFMLPNITGFLQVLQFPGNTGSIRDDSYWTSRENSLELIELSSINIRQHTCSCTSWTSRWNDFLRTGKWRAVGVLSNPAVSSGVMAR